MKKIYLSALSSLGLSLSALAQTQTTALLHSSQLEARGSARYQALSGAIGAIGTDFGTVHQNPAGLALFRSGDKLSFTLNKTAYSSQNKWYSQGTDLKSGASWQVDELSYISNINLGTGYNVSLGIGLQNNGRLRQDVDAFTSKIQGLSSVIDYAASLLNISEEPIPAEHLSKPVAWDNYPWASVLGYNAGWFKNSPYYERAYEQIQASSLRVHERGSISNLDLALGFELPQGFNFGFTATLSSMNYELNSFYKEDFEGKNPAGEPYGISLDNSLKVSGMGARLGLGLLYQFDMGLRLGASIYTPTYFSYQMQLSARATGVDVEGSKMGRKDLFTPKSETSFGLTTPWRFGLSAAQIFARRAILSLDYEYQDFSGLRLRESEEDRYEHAYRSEAIYKQDNEQISSDFGGQHTLRLGLEYNVNKRLQLRAGLRYSSPINYTKELKSNPNKLELGVPATVVHYRLPRTIKGYSLGLGYKLSPRWGLDIAYVLRQQNDHISSFPYIRDNQRANKVFLPNKLIANKQVQSSWSFSLNCRI